MKTLTIREIKDLLEETEKLLVSLDRLIVETQAQLREIQKPRTVILKTERDNE